MLLKFMIDKKDYFTVKELADLLRVSRITVFNRIKSGKIKAKKIGRNYIIYQKDLMDLSTNQLTENDKQNIEIGVKKVLKEYGDTIKMLGKE